MQTHDFLGGEIIGEDFERFPGHLFFGLESNGYGNPY